MRCSHWLALEGQEISMRPTIMYAAHWAINEPGVHAADLCLHGTRTPWGRWMIDDTRLKVCRINLSLLCNQGQVNNAPPGAVGRRVKTLTKYM